MQFFYMPQPIRLWPQSNFFKKLDRDQDYEAEIKYNGWRVEIHYQKRNLILYNRHGTIINIDQNIFLNQFKQFPDNSVFDGELINFRTKKLKNIIILWDIMFLNGKDLRKLPLSQRRQFLDTLTTAPAILKSSHETKVFKIKSYKSNFVKLYDKIIERNDPVEEGIVIKNIHSEYKFNLKSKFDYPKWMKVKKIGDHALI